MAGLGGTLAVFLILAAVGVVAPGRGLPLLVVLQLLGLVAAGWVAGRFAPPGGAAVHGGLAGLLLFVVAGAVSVAAGSGPDPVQLVLLGVVAAVLGSAGGVLADLRR